MRPDGNSVIDMTERRAAERDRKHPIHTRKRGEAVGYEALFAKVDPANKAKVERVAEAIGISQAAAVDLMLSSIEVDANGRPSFWDGDLPGDAQGQIVDGNGQPTPAAIPSPPSYATTERERPLQTAS